MTLPTHGQNLPMSTEPTAGRARSIALASDSPAGREFGSIRWLDPVDEDPGVVVRTCANCGAAMDERKCKLICRCGYFLSCSDYY